MTDAFFFGYGSLVNRATHDYGNAHQASARGWRRVWRHTALRPVAFLTAVPDPDTRIDGLIAGVPNGDWRALDAREHAYDRIDLTELPDHPLPFPPRVAIYSIPPGKHGTPTMAHPILLSYLDVVVQGYLREFGEAGVARFFDTTDGWSAPILDDRAAPHYPRHQPLDPAETTLVDDMLARHGAAPVALTS
ncbi:gamma-glutamylcyclotransferase family protein [Thalassovita taeanensis]|uniref:ChaC-like protein n=1 Tax=Thalassovita taeanensis TaxID=657014 RepID=A0A1H9AP20_9RHOB|nr:gamma-glutamylcyclotransferase family protein [Thalassovita taeanensis]SEP78295.1 ChaC-like protein [Thalassovita taeanensis]